MIGREKYDVIVVGARAAGAATAMLLARRGMRVLAVDRARYGSDTLSTHALMRTGVLQLHRWGLLDAVRASGAPPVRSVTFRYPDETKRVDIKPSEGVDALYAPRRTVLDPILADAARESGAEVRFGVIVDGLLKDGDGRVTGISARDEFGHEFSARADLVVGADGIRSIVALGAGAPTTRQAFAEGAVVFGYFRNIETSGFEWTYAPGLSAGLIPTNDGESCVFVGGSTARFHADVQPALAKGFHHLMGRVSPELAARIAGGEQTGRFRGFAAVRGYYRRPFGPGWALVGDAGLFRDPITTHGISDAFRDAELLARAVDGTSTMAEYERLRDEVSTDLFDVTEKIARYDWSMEEIRRLLYDVSRAMRAEVDLILGWDAPAAEEPQRLAC